MADKINQTNSSKPTTISEHFLCNNHNATDMQLLLLNSLNLIVTVYAREAREAYFIERGQTFKPRGLNKKDETLVLAFCV